MWPRNRRPVVSTRTCLPHAGPGGAASFQFKLLLDLEPARRVRGWTSLRIADGGPRDGMDLGCIGRVRCELCRMELVGAPPAAAPYTHTQPMQARDHTSLVGDIRRAHTSAMARPPLSPRPGALAIARPPAIVCPHYSGADRPGLLGSGILQLRVGRPPNADELRELFYCCAWIGEDCRKLSGK
jgi:hypothetical protein